MNRRAELISATRRVAGRKGLVGTNVRAVAAEASVSTGSVLYYFPSFDDLVYTTVEGVLEEMYERRRVLAEAEPDPERRLVRLITAGVPDVISDHLRMAYECVPLLREHPQYRPLHRSIVERQVSLFRSTIEIGVALGAFHPTADIGTIARNIVALEDAYDLYPLIGLDTPPQVYRQNILSYARTALGGSFDEIVD
jgi:AcrR family transcriptional regulator